MFVTNLAYVSPRSPGGVSERSLTAQPAPWLESVSGYLEPRTGARGPGAGGLGLYPADYVADYDNRELIDYVRL
jgi:hypothetical protein